MSGFHRTIGGTLDKMKQQRLSLNNGHTNIIWARIAWGVDLVEQLAQLYDI